MSKLSHESFGVRDQIASNYILRAGSCPESPTSHVHGQVKEISQFAPTLAKAPSIMRTYPSPVYWRTTENLGYLSLLAAEELLCPVTPHSNLHQMDLIQPPEKKGTTSMKILGKCIQKEGPGTGGLCSTNGG